MQRNTPDALVAGALIESIAHVRIESAANGPGAASATVVVDYVELELHNELP